MKNFYPQDSFTFHRGTYMIILPGSLENFLSNEQLGGNFIKFKKTQGYDVEVVLVENIPFTGSLITAQEIKDYIMDYYDSNPMLEYVLLIGDVNGSLIVPTFTIDSYNEEDIDVTDYPYTFSDNVYEPKFFIGRWPVRSTLDFLNLKSRSIQYVKMDNISNLSYLNNSLLVAGNYKTADGDSVPPSQWPVTPVWTSLWLMEELQDYGYSQIDTAFFHAGNWETGDYNGTIPNKWNEGVGVVNYRGWGDANGWHKPYFHKEDLEQLNNGYNLPIVMSFVCNTGDFGNDYSGTGLNKCFGEVMVTEGTLVNPKGAAAMVGPSDLDTDTRFNNVICGSMWDALLDGNTDELAPALHAGKKSLIYEFSGLSAPDGTIIDEFYHHVYGVLGDPSLPVWLLEPSNFNVDIQDSTQLTVSYVSINLTDQNGNILEGVVGALLDANDDLIAKSVSNSQGELILNFDTNATFDLTLYLNAPQYKQKIIPLNYVSDDGSTYSELVPVDIIFNHTFWHSEINSDVNYFPQNSDYLISIDISAYNNSTETLDFDFEITSLSEFVGTINCGEGVQFCNNVSGCAPGELCNVPTLYFDNTIGAIPGSIIPFTITATSNNYEINDYIFNLVVSEDFNNYATNQPSVQCDYGYKAYDYTDIEYEEHPVYDWIEINQIGTNLNLTDDSVISDVQIGFDFKYFGQTYNSMTICSNGWISFESCSIPYFWNFSIPNPMGPSAMIAPFMDDLDDNGGTTPFNVYAYNIGDGRFIIEWDDVLNGEDDQNCPNCINETFQMILLDPNIYPTATGDGEIIFQYKEIHDIDQNGNYSTIGIESPDQEDGVQYLFSNQASLGSYWQTNSEGFYENIVIKFTTGSYIENCGQMDINLDGVINLLDIISTVNFVVSQSVPSSEELCTYDVNGDSIINLLDIIEIINYIIS